MELKSLINTPDVPNVEPKNPEETREEETEYDLEYHLKRSKVSENIRELYKELDRQIREVNESIWEKYAQTAITYYSPEKTFTYLQFRKNSLFLTIFTDQQKIDGVDNVKDHENWGKISVNDKNDLPRTVSAIRISFELVREAIKNNKNTGWYALSPKN